MNCALTQNSLRKYLNAAADDNDARVYLAALRTVAEAKGMAKVAKAAGVPRESLANIVWENGVFKGMPGSGRFIARTPSPYARPLGRNVLSFGTRLND